MFLCAPSVLVTMCRCDECILHKSRLIIFIQKKEDAIGIKISIWYDRKTFEIYDDLIDKNLDFFHVSYELASTPHKPNHKWLYRSYSAFIDSSINFRATYMSIWAWYVHGTLQRSRLRNDQLQEVIYARKGVNLFHLKFTHFVKRIYAVHRESNLLPHL